MLLIHRISIEVEGHLLVHHLLLLKLLLHLLHKHELLLLLLLLLLLCHHIAHHSVAHHHWVIIEATSSVGAELVEVESIVIRYLIVHHWIETHWRGVDLLPCHEGIADASSLECIGIACESCLELLRRHLLLLLNRLLGDSRLLCRVISVQ